MLYLIKDKYYMLRNREYVKVDLELRNGELDIKPDRKDVIEANDDIKVKSITIDNVIKELKDKDSYRSNTKNKYDM